MNIAVFIKGTTFHKGFGGLETQNKLLCEGLSQRGHTITVFSPQKDLKELQLSENGVNYIFTPCTFKMGFFASHQKNNWLNKSYQAFLEVNSLNKFDLVVSQSSAGLGVINHKKDLKIKIVSISHGTIVGEFKSATRNLFSPKQLVKWILDAFFVFRNFFGRQRAFIYGSDHLVAVSNSVKRAVIDETFVPEDFVTVIHNGIDENKFANFTRYSNPQKVNLIYVGRVIKEKGVFDLVKVVEQLKNENVHLTIVGSGADFESLKQQVSDKNLKDIVTFSGSLKYEDALYKLFESDIFILPTLRVEGFPMTLVEAMFAELPVVATNIGGISDAVQDGNTGMLVKPGDLNGLKDKILELVKNADLRQQMGKSGKMYAQNNFSLNTMLTKYEQVFKEVLG